VFGIGMMHGILFALISIHVCFEEIIFYFPNYEGFNEFIDELAEFNTTNKVKNH